MDNIENVIQFDLASYDEEAIQSSYTAVNGASSSWDGAVGLVQSIQLAMDGKIYIGDNYSYLDVINNPNAKGAACNFQDSAVFLMDKRSIGSLPAFVSSWLSQPPDAGLECAKPHVKFEADTVLCAGEYLKLNDLTRRNPADWSWTFEGGEPASFDGPEPPEILYRNPGVFTIKLVALNDNGADSGEVVVRVNPKPNLDAGPDLTVCRGESVQLLATGAQRYEWHDDVGIGDINNPQQNFTPDASGEYVVCGWNEFDCMDCDTVLVTVADKLTAEAGEDVQICRGESIVLNGSGGAEFLWTPAAGLDDNRKANPTASPRQTTRYRLQVGSGACQAVDSVLVEVLDVPEVEAGPDQTICPGESVQLTASGAERYEWSPDAGLDDVNSATPKAAPTETTNYRVLGFNNSDCVDSAFVTVNVVNELDVQIEVPEPACRGSVVQLSATGAQSYSWEPEGLFDDANSATPRLTLEENITVRVTGRSGGCEATVDVELEVLPDPVVTIEPAAEICAGESVELRASGATTYRWEPADGLDDVNSATPTAAPRQTTVYTVTGTDNNGCEAQASVTVNVRPAAELEFEVVRLNDRPATPGEERIVQVRLNGDASDIKNLNITDLSLTLEYPLNGLGLRRGHEDMLPGWTWTVTEDLAANSVEFNGMGESVLTSGVLFQLPLTVFQFPYDSLFAHIDITASSLSGACIDLRFIPGGIPLSPVCLSQSRNIGLTGIGFGLRTPSPNPASGSFDIEFSTGFEVNTTVEIYNTLGTRVEVVANETLAAGEYVRRVSNLAAGVYQIVMRAGPYSASRSVVVGE